MSLFSRADRSLGRLRSLAKLPWPDITDRNVAWLRSAAVSLALILVLAAPFLLRPHGRPQRVPAANILVVLSPHNDTIRNEIAQGFAAHMKETQGKSVRIDWRDVGGASEISKFVSNSFQSAFQLHWRRDLKKKWQGRATSPGQAAVQKSVPDDTPADDTQEQEARRAFLASQVGIGVDLLFGGGSNDFIRHAACGHLVDSGIFEKEPGWFTEEVIPAQFSGEALYDPGKRWVGSCLSSFGICYNVDWIRRLQVEPPRQWEDLGDPKYLNTLALADPSKSSSTTKAFEMILQQQLSAAFAEVDREGVADVAPMESNALDKGWTAGLNLIQRIAANARYFTDASAKIPFDVAQGNAAAGMSIDFYGRALNEAVKKPDGSSRVQFVIPAGGTSVGADPVGLLRGAPHPALAQDFIHYLLSPEGQRLWHYRAGTPGGPVHHALRRMPIRQDLYTPEELQNSSDPELNPFVQARDFQYHPDWTNPHFNVIRFIIQVMCMETHEELKEAWSSLIRAGFPPRASRIFFDVKFVGYTNVTHELTPKLMTDDPLAIQKRRRDLRESFRKNYRLATEFANRGE